MGWDANIDSFCHMDVQEAFLHVFTTIPYFPSNLPSQVEKLLDDGFGHYQEPHLNYAPCYFPMPRLYHILRAKCNVLSEPLSSSKVLPFISKLKVLELWLEVVDVEYEQP